VRYLGEGCEDVMGRGHAGKYRPRDYCTIRVALFGHDVHLLLQRNWSPCFWDVGTQCHCYCMCSETHHNDEIVY